MILTHPIQPDACKSLLGQHVCVVLHDGTEHVGILSRLEGGKLILNDAPEAAGVSRTGKASKTAKTSAKASLRRKNKAASVSAVTGYPYPVFPFPGPRLALDLAAIALLFLLVI